MSGEGAVMKIIKEISNQIEEEIEGAEWYAKRAIQYKEEYPELAKVLYEISTEEMHHVGLLHAEVVKIIEEYRKQRGDPPAPMLAVYEYLHEKQIEASNKVRMYQGQYRDSK
jgi:hypothetical protein